MLTITEAKNKFTALFKKKYGENGMYKIVLDIALETMEDWFNLQGKEVARFHKYHGKIGGEWPIYLQCEKWATDELKTGMLNALKNNEVELGLNRYMKLNIITFDTGGYEPGYAFIGVCRHPFDREAYSMLRDGEMWRKYGLLTLSTRPFVNLIRYPFETRYYTDSRNVRGLLQYTSQEVIDNGEEIPTLHYVIADSSGRSNLVKLTKSFYKGYRETDEDSKVMISEFVTPTNKALAQIVLEETYGSPERALEIKE